MDDLTLRLLGLDRLLDAAAGLCRSETARLRARALKPYGRWEEAQETLAAVEGLRTWLSQRHDVPVPDDVEYRGAADILDTGRSLHGDELFRLGIYLSDLGRLAEGLPEAPWLPPETFGQVSSIQSTLV